MATRIDTNSGWTFELAPRSVRVRRAWGGSALHEILEVVPAVVVGSSSGPVKTDGRLLATVGRGAINLTSNQRIMFTNMTMGLCDQEVTGNSVGVWHVKPISGGTNGRSAPRTDGTLDAQRGGAIAGDPR